MPKPLFFPKAALNGLPHVKELTLGGKDLVRAWSIPCRFGNEFYPLRQLAHQPNGR